MQREYKCLIQSHRDNHEHPSFVTNRGQSIPSHVKATAAPRAAKDSVASEKKAAMALAGKQTLEAFIEYIESDSLKRKKWLSRVREAGFDQALSEYREMRSPNGMPLQM